jgi:hypothetical protein
MKTLDGPHSAGRKPLMAERTEMSFRRKEMSPIPKISLQYVTALAANRRYGGTERDIQMKKLFYTLILTGLFAAALTAGPQDQQQSAPPNQRAGARLQQDLAKAVRNATLTDDQKKTLQDGGSRLREAREAKQNGEKVDRGSVKKALGEIRQVTESGAFKSEDEAAVKADLDALGGSHEGRRRLFRGR